MNVPAHSEWAGLPIRLVVGGILAASSLVMVPPQVADAADGCVDPGWLGSASPFTVLGLEGTAVNLHNVSVSGDVAAATGGSVTVMSPSSVSGDVYLSPGAAYQQDGTVTGVVLTDQDLSSAVADARAASSFLATLAVDQTFASWTGSQTVVGNGGVTVIEVGDISMGGGAITLSGGCFFVINVTGTFDMGGDASITGVDPSQVYLNLTGTGTMTTHVGNSLEAIILAPDATLSLDGVFHGKVIGGGTEIKFLSGAQMTGLPTDPAPSPSIDAGSTPDPTPTDSPAPTDSAAPTPAPTDTPEPTYTPPPTATPSQPSTPAPSSTPVPTPTTPSGSPDPSPEPPGLPDTAMPDTAMPDTASGADHPGPGGVASALALVVTAFLFAVISTRRRKAAHHLVSASGPWSTAPFEGGRWHRARIRAQIESGPAVRRGRLPLRKGGVSGCRAAAGLAS